MSTTLRWGQDAPGDPDTARERLLDAAAVCVERYGVAKTTMDDVATTANVSRTTVYRYFAGRDEIVLAVLLRDIDALFDRLRQSYDDAPTFADAIVDGLVLTVRGIANKAHLHALFAPDVASTTTRIAGASDALRERVTAFMAPFLERWRDQGEVRSDVSIDEIIEWLLYAILTLLRPENLERQSEARLRQLMRLFVVPGLLANPPPSGASTDGDGGRT